MGLIKRYLAKIRMLFARSNKNKKGARAIAQKADYDFHKPELVINDDGSIHYFGSAVTEDAIQDESINYRKQKESDDQLVIAAGAAMPYSYGSRKSADNIDSDSSDGSTKSTLSSSSTPSTVSSYNSYGSHGSSDDSRSSSSSSSSSGSSYSSYSSDSSSSSSSCDSGGGGGGGD